MNLIPSADCNSNCLLWMECSVMSRSWYSHCCGQLFFSTSPCLSLWPDFVLYLIHCSFAPVVHMLFLFLAFSICTTCLHFWENITPNLCDQYQLACLASAKSPSVSHLIVTTPSFASLLFKFIEDVNNFDVFSRNTSYPPPFDGHAYFMTSVSCVPLLHCFQKHLLHVWSIQIFVE